MNPLDQYIAKQNQSQQNPLDEYIAKQGEDQQSPDDAKKATGEIGNQNYNGYCEAFAEKMTGKPNMGATAAEAFDNYAKAGQAIQGTQGIQPGDLIYFAPDSSNNDAGHVGIYQGNGTMVSASYDGVKQSSINDWLAQTGQTIKGYVKP